MSGFCLSLAPWFRGSVSLALQTGVPAQLLDNRPDMMRAEYNVMSAYEMTNSARAFFTQP
jgi:outer membrane protein TolC